MNQLSDLFSLLARCCSLLLSRFNPVEVGGRKELKPVLLPKPETRETTPEGSETQQGHTGNAWERGN